MRISQLQFDELVFLHVMFYYRKNSVPKDLEKGGYLFSLKNLIIDRHQQIEITFAKKIQNLLRFKPYYSFLNHQTDYFYTFDNIVDIRKFQVSVLPEPTIQAIIVAQLNRRFGTNFEYTSMQSATTPFNSIVDSSKKKLFHLILIRQFLEIHGPSIVLGLLFIGLSQLFICNISIIAMLSLIGAILGLLCRVDDYGFYQSQSMTACLLIQCLFIPKCFIIIPPLLGGFICIQSLKCFNRKREMPKLKDPSLFFKPPRMKQYYQNHSIDWMILNQELAKTYAKTTDVSYAENLYQVLKLFITMENIPTITAKAIVLFELIKSDHTHTIELITLLLTLGVDPNATPSISNNLSCPSLHAAAQTK
ncbi:MAG TPA: hypothetical protein VHD33_04555, partial [Legionellaceae bacterium]|nr:hypothetical protein [Legionellaceae bacterium]